MSRQLNVLFPRAGHILSQDKPCLPRLLPHPHSPPFLFDVLCSHAVFSHPLISPHFPPDTKYVAIVRDPWQLVQSAYHFYTTTFHARYLKTSRSFGEFIRNQSRYEPRSKPYSSFTNNRMSLDLGLPASQLTNASHVAPFLRELGRVFHLVLIADRFDMSMVLMRRVLRWTMKDIVYQQLNYGLNRSRGKKKTAEFPDPELEKRFKRFQVFDVALYEHYVKVFDRKIAAEGRGFYEELVVFRRIARRIWEFCGGGGLRSTTPELVIPGSRWNEQFRVRHAECDVLSASEIKLTFVAKAKQLIRLAPFIDD